MLKKLFVPLFVATALFFVGCNKDDDPTTDNDGKVTQADLVGSWGWDNKPSFVFNADGTYTETRWESTASGKWSLNESKLTLTPTGAAAWDVDIVLTGGKAWLVFVYEDGEGENKYRSYENFRKIGATVNSGTLSDGRWDAPRDGFHPETYSKSTSYTFCMIISGKTVDLYVPMWGYHIQGTFTLSDGRMHIDTDDDHIWWGAYKTGDSESGSIGWQAAGPPDEDFEATWDYSYGSMDAETFKLQSPYTWYSVNDILKMGKKPDPNDEEYKLEPYLFKFMLYEVGENLRDNAMDLCDFDLCVAANGKEAYGGAVGLSPWLYKRQ